MEQENYDEQRQVQRAEERGLLYRGKEGAGVAVVALHCPWAVGSLFLGQEEAFLPDRVCGLLLMPV